MCFVFHAEAFDDVMTSKFDYLKNEKSFRSEVKYIFVRFTSALF